MATTTHSYEVDWVFGTSVDKLIEKLLELKKKHPEAIDIYLDEEWTGYEEVEFHVVYEREETEQDIQERLEVARKEQERLEGIHKESLFQESNEVAIKNALEEVARLKLLRSYRVGYIL